MIRCAIIGASGYTGAELIGLLLGHTHAELVGLFGSSGRDGARRVSDLHPRFRGQCDAPIEPTSIAGVLASAPDAVFLCTPHEAGATLAAELQDAGFAGVMLDLSAAFRMRDAHAYQQYYGFVHPRPALLEHAVYGLVERNREALRTADLVAVPGCYPTSVLLPLAPLVEAGAVAPGTRPIADCTSGVSGAGRTPTGRNLFCEVSAQPYAVWTHRHNPEIRQHAAADVIFTPHLGPFDRGIVSTIHVQLAPGWDESRVRELLASIYDSAPFVRLLSPGAWPSVNAVKHTNFCDIALGAENAHCILISAIDNLVKGASGQAVQCMNIRFGLPETTGLLPGRDAPIAAAVTQGDPA